VLSPDSGYVQLLQKGTPELFHDIRLAAEASKNVVYKTTTTFFNHILDEQNFQAYVQKQTKMLGKVSDHHVVAQNDRKRNQLLNFTDSTIPFNRKAAQKQLEEMSSSILLSGFRLFFWYFNKNLRQIIQGLWIDTQSVKMVKDLISANNKVILIPLY